MNALERAIVRTLFYGDVFSFPMTAAEIHYYLIEVRATAAEVQQTLAQPSPDLAQWLIREQVGSLTCYAIVGRGSIFEARRQREVASQHLWRQARRYGVWLGYLPFVQMVALTGALAVRNAGSTDDDLDYLLVVREGRVWLARLFAVMLVRLTKLWGVVLCPNYVLAENSLAQDERHLFMAHEITQMVPVVGHRWYHQMRDANQWTEVVLPNAQGVFYQEPDQQPRFLGRWLKHSLEWLFGGRWGDALERWEMQRKIRKFQPQLLTASEVQLDEHQVKGHFISYGQATLERYHARLEAHGLLNDPAASAAD
ncbi:MAG: hypothetical protein H6673_04500 [Anaerolineales bacterium]|nr:hypothetical protein [Anaerolineales bacterium]